MSFTFRKRFHFGPFNINLSKSGIGASFGVPGFRVGHGPRGRYANFCIPGTGIGYRMNESKKRALKSAKMLKALSQAVEPTTVFHESQLIHLEPTKIDMWVPIFCIIAVLPFGFIEIVRFGLLDALFG